MRRPVVSYALAALTLLEISCASQAQETSSATVSAVPRLDVSLGYQFVHANAPPGGPDKFNLNGGFASVAVKYKYWLSFAGEFTGTHANQISVIGQDLTLTTFTGGPRVTLRGPRLQPFAQAMFGAAHGSDSYFPTATSYTTSATTFALSTGGGLDVALRKHLAVRALEVQYLHTGFNNGVNTSQNQLLLGAGVVFKFHSGYDVPHTRVKQIHTRVRPLPPPMLDKPIPAPPPATETAPPPSTNTTSATFSAPMGPRDNDFREHVADVYFDSESDNVLPAALASIKKAATYLKAHPLLHVLIGGYSDERGTPEYNLALSDRRAAAIRNALVQQGVELSRIAIMSYGKSTQVCTSPSEDCYQRNRRATITPLP